MKKGIIFDLDGTLWDTTEEIVPAMNRVLARNGQKQTSKEEMLRLMGKTGEEIAALLMPGLPADKAMRIFDDCRLEEQKHLRRYGGVLYPRLEETLRELKKDCALYIVSNCHSEYLNAFFIAHGLKNYFDDFETHGSTGHSKAENIKLVVNRNSLDSAVYVGDTALDETAARLAEIPFIYAAYGFGRIIGAKHEIKQFSDLKECVLTVI